MGRGKLYSYIDGQFKSDVNYQLHRDLAANCCGELALLENKNVDDSAGYIIELEDNRRSRCYLRKRVNRAVTGTPARYIYHFVGVSPLE